MVQDTSPELFKVEKKRITDKTFDVNQVGKPAGQSYNQKNDKADFWEQELRLVQEEAALRYRSNSAGVEEKKIIEVPEAVPEAGQMSASKSDSRFSDAELYQYYEIKPPSNCKVIEK